MGKVYDAIDGSLREFIEAQRLFFVATAPSELDGHVNLSPKGSSSLCVLDERTVSYLDFVGSGVETIAHLRQNARIVVMLCAFEGPPRIVRIHGRGEVLEPEAQSFAAHRSRFPAEAAGGVRSIIVIRAERVSDSCGYGVPLYRYEGERKQLGAWAEKRGPEGLREYQLRKNARSLDGLPGLSWANEE